MGRPRKNPISSQGTGVWVPPALSVLSELMNAENAQRFIDQCVDARERLTGDASEQNKTREYIDRVLIPKAQGMLREFSLVEALRSYKIKNKMMQVVNFEPKPAQMRVIRAVEEKWAAKEWVWLIELKARQIGFSTLTALLNYYWLKKHAGMDGICVSHNMESATKISQMYERAWQNDTAGNRRDLRRVKNNIVFSEESGGGALNILSGYSEDAANSFTVPVAHLDEIAKYRAADTAIASMMEAVPLNEMTLITMVSTADGMGWFKDAWDGKDDGLIRIFSPWHEEPTYRTEFKSDDERQAFEESMSADEREHQALYKLELEQLKWRRDKKNMPHFRTNPELFRQENPAEPEEAFLGTGSRFFSFDLSGHVAHTGKVAADARYRMYSLVGGELKPDPQGDITVYHLPDKRKEYVWGADPAEGKQADEKGRKHDPDKCVLKVLDRGGYLFDNNAPAEEVLSWEGILQPHEFAELIVAVSKFFNDCKGLPEANGAGYSLIENIYRIRKECLFLVNRAKRMNVMAPRTLWDYGWREDVSSRKVLLGKVADALCPEEKVVIGQDEHDPADVQKKLIVNDERLIEQVLQMRNKKGIGTMPAGKHDDHIFTLGLCLIANSKDPCGGMYLIPRRHYGASFQDVDAQNSFDRMKRLGALKTGESYAGLTAVN